MPISWSTQNTCKGFLSLQHGLSVWFTRLHNHGEDCWSDSCPEDNHWHPSQWRVSHKHSLPKKLAVHRVLYPSMLIRMLSGRETCGRKRCTTNLREAAALWGLSSKIDSRIWVNFTRNELRLESSRATTHRRVKEFGYSCRQRCLTWAKEKKNWTVPSGPKSSLQMRASFVFHLEIKVLESGGRVEKLIAQVAWSPVLSLHSLWWFGVQCHLLVLVHCVFWKPTVTAPAYQDILEHFILPSADQHFKDADLIFQQDLAPAHTAKSTKSWLNDHGVGVLDWPANSPDLTRPWYCQEENGKQETKKCRWAEGHCQRNLGFHTTSAVPQTDHLHATPNWGSN